MRLTHDGLVGVRVAYRVRSRNDPCTRELGRPSVLNLQKRQRSYFTPLGIYFISISELRHKCAATVSCSEVRGWLGRYLFTPWRAGVWRRGAGDVQGAGATAGGGGTSNPNREEDSSSQTRSSSPRPLKAPIGWARF